MQRNIAEEIGLCEISQRPQSSLASIDSINISNVCFWMNRIASQTPTSQAKMNFDWRRVKFIAARNKNGP